MTRAKEWAPAAPGRLTVDLQALVRNFHSLAEKAAPASLGAVVKADAYGLGTGPVAGALWRAGCTDFFVATVAEGLTLRRMLDEARIYLFDGIGAGEARIAAAAGLIPVLNDMLQIHEWADFNKGRRRPAPSVLHVDTGMTRLGMDAAEAAQLAADPDLCGALNLRLVMSHLACADTPEHPMNAEQRDAFRQISALFPGVATSLANSAGLFLGPEYVGDMARCGIGLYGGNPFTFHLNPTTEVAQLTGRILKLWSIDTPRSVGYGATHRAAAGRRIATVGVGYGDGYPRCLGNQAEAVVGGHRVPVVGRVSMDLLTLDVTDAPADAARPGTEATLIGGAVSLDEISRWAGTIPYEILTRLGPRLARHYLPAPPEDET